MLDFYRFQPVYMHTLWGGDTLARFKHAPLSQLTGVGESWELSGLTGNETVVASGPDAGLTPAQLVERHGAALVGESVLQRYGNQLPLLVKFLDTRDRLSVQVHPRGKKNEMWYVVDANPGAHIRLGFKRDITLAEFDHLVTEGDISTVLRVHDSKPGDVYYIPAGQIHTIGPGNLIAEIQQPCDITLRIHDFGRRDAQGNLRELHLEQARHELSFDAYNGLCPYPRVAGKSTTVVNSPSFAVSRFEVDGEHQITFDGEPRFHVLMGIRGQATLTAGSHSTILHQGETILAPAIMTTMQAAGQGVFLIATV